MSLGNRILEKIKEEKAKPGEKQKDKFTFAEHQENDCHVQVKFKDIDKYGIVVDYITVSIETPILDVAIINNKLQKQSDAVQQTITYLLEDFKLIELDRMNKKAQLRSYPPHKEEDSKFYYEIILDDGTKAHFQRYEYSSTKRRFEKITSQLTLETFVRLVDDMADILCT